MSNLERAVKSANRLIKRVNITSGQCSVTAKSRAAYWMLNALWIQACRVRDELEAQQGKKRITTKSGIARFQVAIEALEWVAVTYKKPAPENSDIAPVVAAILKVAEARENKE